MKSLRFGAALLLCTMATPALGQSQVKDGSGHTGSAEMRALDADLTAYGEWLVRLDRATAGATAALGTMQGEWAAVARSGSSELASARFRTVIASAKTKVAEARRQIAALDKPEFPGLELPDDITTAALAGQMNKLYDRVDQLLDGFGPLLDAMARRDLKAVETTSSEMLGAARFLLETQAIMANASLATTDRDSGAYEIQLFQVHFFRSASRIVQGAKQVLLGEKDPTLTKDLTEFADKLESVAAEGRAKIDGELAEWEGMVATAEKGTDAKAMRILIRTAKVLRIDRRILEEPASSYVAALRATAARARTGSIVPGDVYVLMRAFAKMRDVMLQVGLEENAAMAES